VDTRSKILSVAAARALQPARPLAMAAGYFDVLRASHTRELLAARERSGAATLMAVVMPRQGEWLSQSARAELAAALRMVDYAVLAAESDLTELRAALDPQEFTDLRAAEEGWLRELQSRIQETAG
jgi:glycerol-3-phosphate cytidylyltransferase-like family protein